MRKRALDRILVELPGGASQRQHRELGAFVRFCVFRLEREFGELRWLVRVQPANGNFACFVAVNDRNCIVESRGGGFDHTLAIWEALSNVEQGLRESRAIRHEEQDQANHAITWDTLTGKG